MPRQICFFHVKKSVELPFWHEPGVDIQSLQLSLGLDRINPFLDSAASFLSNIRRKSVPSILISTLHTTGPPAHRLDC